MDWAIGDTVVDLVLYPKRIQNAETFMTSPGFADKLYS